MTLPQPGYAESHSLRSCLSALANPAMVPYAEKAPTFRWCPSCQDVSHRENLTLTARQGLKKLLAANQRLNTA